MRRLTLISLIALTAAVPAAEAKAPPKGDYGCTYTTFSGTFYSGTLNILNKTKYKVNDKNKGEYVNKSRKRIKFKTGSYKGLWKGKWSKNESVLNPGTWIYVIKLTSIEDPEGTPTMECTRDSS
jgi:hypothetical protein